MTDDKELASLGLRSEDLDSSRDVFSVRLCVTQASVRDLDVAYIVLYPTEHESVHVVSSAFPSDVPLGRQDRDERPRRPCLLSSKGRSVHEEDDASLRALDAIRADDPAVVLVPVQAERRVSGFGSECPGHQLGSHHDGLYKRLAVGLHRCGTLLTAARTPATARAIEIRFVNRMLRFRVEGCFVWSRSCLAAP
jgi:hypothetical protein